MDHDMQRVKYALAPELRARMGESGIAWLVDFAAEIMATLTADELDALARGDLRPSADALAALDEHESADELADDDAPDGGPAVVNGTADGCQIRQFLHCAQCGDERPDGQSPREWARLEFGLTADRRLQVWCIRHDCEVGTFRLSPQSIRVQPGCEHV